MKSALEVNREYSEDYVQKLTTYKVPKMLEDYTGVYVDFLDLGCGDGRLITSIKKDYPKAKVTGVDISPRRIKKLILTFPFDTFLVEDVCHTSLKSESFDLIACEQTIEHVEDDKVLVKEIDRLLIPGGRLYITSVLKMPLAWYKYKNRHGKRCLDPTHEREYPSNKAFLDLFKEYHLIDTKTTHVGRLFHGINIIIPGYYIIEALFKKSK